MIPSYEEAKRITEASPAFYENQIEVCGYTVSVFNYLLAEYRDFEEHNAFELRGLMFVHDGKERIPWPALHKFFNISQAPGYMYEDVKDKKIVNIQDKLDGSMITFVRFPNGVVHARTKQSFTNEQALMAQEIYESDLTTRLLVVGSIDRGLVPIFELISPLNQIVIEYPKTELRLIQMRNILSGEYVPMDGIEETMTIEEIMEWQETATGVEGLVVTFEDGQKLKAKTSEYFQLHGLYTEDLNRENILIKYVLEETFDDVMSKVTSEMARKRAGDIAERIVRKFDEAVVYINKHVQTGLQGRELYERVKEHPYSGVIMKGGNLEQIKENLKNYLLKYCYKLEKARSWLYEGE